MKKMEEFPETEKCDCQLASKQSPEITADSGKRNQKKTLAIRSSSPTVLTKKEEAVYPSPFKMLTSVEFV